MTDTEKLRALLAEARESVEADASFCVKLMPDGTSRSLANLLQRIDAALAEPVVVHPSNMTTIIDVLETDLQEAREIAKRNAQDCSHLRQSAITLERERDEARAEVERLRSLKPIGTYSLDWNHEQERINTARAAYQRGAEAMRAAAAREADRMTMSFHEDDAGEAIRALPIPEDKP